MKENEMKIIDRLFNQINYRSRIDQLINDIKMINSYDEYLRLKYYNQMIFKIKLLNYYIGVSI